MQVSIERSTSAKIFLFTFAFLCDTLTCKFPSEAEDEGQAVK
jgi:hypothetical protein